MKTRITPGISMFLAVLGGALLVAATLGGFWVACNAASVDGTGLCSVIKKNPPWFIVTALAAVPSVLLTWYWRDQHKRSDLALLRLQQLHQDFGMLLQQATDPKHSGSQAAAILALPPYIKGPYDFSQSQNPFRRPALAAIANALRESSAAEKVSGLGSDSRLLQEASQAAIELCKEYLSGLHLIHAKMHCPNLEHADLRDAHLEHAVLWRGRLRGALLDRAHLAFTCLYGADLEGSTIEKAYCVDALYDDHTRFPSGFDPKEHGMAKKETKPNEQG